MFSLLACENMIGVLDLARWMAFCEVLPSVCFRSHPPLWPAAHWSPEQPPLALTAGNSVLCRCRHHQRKHLDLSQTGLEYRKHSCDGDVSIAIRQRCSCHIGMHSSQWTCTFSLSGCWLACSGPLCVPTAVFWLHCFRFKDEKYIIKKYASKYFNGIYQISFLSLTSFFFNFTLSFSWLQNTRYFPQWKSLKEEKKNICSYKNNVSF